RTFRAVPATRSSAWSPTPARRCNEQAAPVPEAEAAPAPRSGWGPGSGARVGNLYGRLLALIFLIAWISLGRQVRLLIGARGLLPIGDFIDAIRARGGVSFIDFPTVFWWFHGDAALVGGTLAGAALAIAALC